MKMRRRRSRNRRPRSRRVVWGHDVDDQFLAVDAVIMGSTDEVEWAGPVKIDNALAIVEGCNGPACVTVIVIPFFHTKN